MEILASNLIKNQNDDFVFFITVLAIFREIPPEQYDFIFSKKESYVQKYSIKTCIIRLYTILNNNDKLLPYLIIPLSYYYYCQKCT